MPRFGGFKAFFATLTVNRSRKSRFDRDRLMLIFAITLTIGLVVFYVLSKFAS